MTRGLLVRSSLICVGKLRAYCTQVIIGVPPEADEKPLTFTESFDMFELCLVTPELLGLNSDQSIASYTFWQAIHLALEPKVTLTLLCTAPTPIDKHTERQSLTMTLKRRNITLAFLDEHVEKGSLDFGVIDPIDFTERSNRVSHFLARHKFNAVFFDDHGAEAFIAMRKKRLGLLHTKTQLCLSLHDPLLMQRQSRQTFVDDPVNLSKEIYAQQYAITHADQIMSPSTKALEWAKTYALCDRQRILHTPYLTQKLSQTNDTCAPDPCHIAADHLIFWGVFDTAAGIQTFCNALKKVVSTSLTHKIDRISFVGQNGVLADGVQSENYLKAASTFLKTYGILVSIVDASSRRQGLTYVRKVPGIVMVCNESRPADGDIALLQAEGVPFIYLQAGFARTKDHDDGFPGDPQVQCQRYLQDLSERQKLAGQSLTKDATATESENHQDHIMALAHAFSASGRQTKCAETSERLSVTVCIPYYNHAAFLPQLLSALAAQDLSDFTVIVVNNGSTDPKSNSVFEEVEHLYKNRGWTFLRKQNKGPNAARNFAARHATSDLVLFMDADNVPEPHMLRTFVASMQTSRIDCLTCWFRAFRSDAGGIEAPTAYLGRPLGPCLEVAMLENVLGDVNFCVRRDVFFALNGFDESPEMVWSDWEFLLRLALDGKYTFDVCPETLFHFRHLDDSLSHKDNIVTMQADAVSAYKIADASFLSETLVHVLVPMARKAGYAPKALQHVVF